MTEEEIKLRCIEMAATSIRCDLRSLVIHGDNIFKVVYPYLKEGKSPKDDNS